MPGTKMQLKTIVPRSYVISISFKIYVFPKEDYYV